MILAQDDDAVGCFLAVILIIVIGLIYFMPTLVAFKRNHPNRWVIFVLNLCLGATLVAWLICLIWAFRKIHDPLESKDGSRGGESGLNFFINDVKTVRVISQEANRESSHQNTVIEDLSKLNELKEKGVLNNEEFEAAKKKLLSS